MPFIAASFIVGWHNKPLTMRLSTLKGILQEKSTINLKAFFKL